MGILGTLGALNILISGDTSPFQSAMTKTAYVAEKNLQKISRNAKITSGIITGVLATGTALLLKKMSEISQKADDFDKVAKSVGMTVEEVSKLNYTASLAGVTINDLQTAFVKLNKSTFENSNTFKSLGINIKNQEGAIKSTNDILFEVADRFSQMQDGAMKTSIAVELFGRSGAKLIPILNQGAEGLRKSGIEAEKFGQVFTAELTARAKSFNDSMTKMSKQFEGIFLVIGDKLIPVMSGLIENIFKTNEGFGKLEGTAKVITQALVLMTNTMLVLGQTAISLKDTLLVTFGNIHEALKGVTSFTFALFGVKAQYQEKAFVTQARNDLANLAQTWSDLALTIQSNWDLVDERVSNVSSTISDIAEESKSVVVELKEDFEKSTKNIQSMADGIGNAFASAFDRAILEGQKFKDVMIGLLEDIQSAVVRSLITQPIGQAISGGISSFFAPAPVKSAKGNVFAFASGGIINRPMVFPMGGGRTGLAGEAGAEAIMPLTRMPSGDLGVKASGGSKVQVNIYAPEGSSVSEDRQQIGDMEQINIMIDEAVSGNISRANSKTNRALRSTFGLATGLNKR